ncbi:MAG TPA: GNAT family N-acetyltransferase [Patescibacteria group bacterium]|nr:GNAT family N-acetyltransferase [Patescibacteria group bacterium]
MSYQSQLTPEILEKITQMASEGYNQNEIGAELKIDRQNINYWIKKYNINMVSRLGKKHYDKQNKFLLVLEQALKDNQKIKLNQTIRQLEIHPETAKKILNQHPQYRAVIRGKFDAHKEDCSLPIDILQQRLPDQSHKIISSQNTFVTILAPDGFIYEKAFAKIFQGDPRNKCGKTLTIDQVRDQLKALGYTLIEESYSIKRFPLKAIHDKCGFIRENRLTNFYSQDCGHCSCNGTSKTEGIVHNWITSFGFHAEKLRFKGKTKGKELDIYIPSLNLAIEYNGLHWHSERIPKHAENHNYHYDKMKQANEQGIRLITIFEDEWLDRNSQVKNYLKSVLGIYDRKIYARKCELKEVERSIAAKFLDDHHIQGKTTFKIAFGLYFEDELLGLVTGNIHHRQKGEGTPFVLNRLVFKDGVQILGGASRLVKKLTEYAKDMGYKELISWSDNRYSEGTVYEKCGFKLVEHLLPDYSYVAPDMTRQSKQSNKKDLLLKKGAVGTMANTEKELAMSLELYRIWDCGKKRWSILL